MGLGDRLRRFFGSRPAATSPAVLTPVASLFPGADYHHAFIHADERDVVRGLDGWSWLGVQHLKPLVVGAFGDVFFCDGEGIVVLDTLEGMLKPAARDLPHLREILASEAGRDEWLLDGLVIGARAAGMTPGPGQCYDFKLAPVVGGGFGIDNITTISLVVKLHVAGQLHRQIKDLPEGAKVNFHFDGPSP